MRKIVSHAWSKQNKHNSNHEIVQWKLKLKVSKPNKQTTPKPTFEICVYLVTIKKNSRRALRKLTHIYPTWIFSSNIVVNSQKFSVSSAFRCYAQQQVELSMKKNSLNSLFSLNSCNSRRRSFFSSKIYLNKQKKNLEEFQISKYYRRKCFIGKRNLMFHIVAILKLS